MSRRESRSSVATRQNDALFEFENFKKKFLLANKHITKLNSTLSLRIEELNAQISTLYVENLRLRASEIALAAQIKREREKSRNIMAEAETASINLTKQLKLIRQNYNIQTSAPDPPSPSSPRALQRPPRPDPNHVPSPDSPIRGPRIAIAPNVPDIDEDNELVLSSFPSDEGDIHKIHATPRRKSSSTRGMSSSSSFSGPGPSSHARAKLSASKSVPPSRSQSAHLVDAPSVPAPQDTSKPLVVDLTTTITKRKTSRRQSGLMDSEAAKEALGIPRAPSPAFGSPVRREAGLAVAVDEIAAENAELALDAAATIRKERKKSIRREKEKERERERDVEPEEVIVVKKKRPRERVINEDELLEEDPGSTRQSRLKDVTNSPRSKVSALFEEPPDMISRPLSSSQLPTPRTSLSPAPPEEVPTEEELNAQSTSGGRERRTRKSVNYAEPKLNTKMRKPDVIPPPPSAAAALKKARSSAAAVMTNVAYSKKPGMEGLKSRYQYDTNDEVDPEAEDGSSNAEGSGALASSRSSVEPPRHHATSPFDPAMLPLPPSRPSSSMSIAARIGTPAPASKAASTSSTTTTPAIVKRKKSRHSLVLSDEDDDGAQADAEYGAYGSTKSGGSDLEMLGVRGVSGWVNVESRRKGGTSSRRAIALQDVDEGRRHSMAV